MDDSKKKKEAKKKMKYVEPELVPLDHDHVAEGGIPAACRDGSGNSEECNAGAGGAA